MLTTEPLLTQTLAWQALVAVAHGDSPGVDGLALAGTGWHTRQAVSDDARMLLDCLTNVAAHCGPLAMAQLGQSLDGRIATDSGHSHYINGLESRVHLHRLRALVDAVVVGAGTASEDDPQLTVRHVTGPNPVRVILDPRGRVPSDITLLRNDSAPTLHLHGEGMTPIGKPAAHVQRVALPVAHRGFEPAEVLAVLAERGLPRVLIEGGGITVSRFLEANVLDRLHLLVAPLLIGSGRPGLCLPPIATLDDARRPLTRTFPCGDDTLFDLDLFDLDRRHSAP